MMICRLTIPCLCVLCLAACTHHEDAESTPIAEERTAEDAAAQLGNPLLANKGDINAVNISVSSSEELEKIDNGSDEELIWTNPDDPDAEIPGLSEAFQNKIRGNGWQKSFANAAQLARRQEMPLVVWFHDSVLSPRSKELGDDYLNTKEFDSWSRDRVVRLLLDSGASLNDSTASSAPYSYHKINALKKSYGLKEKPAVAVVSANGKITARIDGYDGDVRFFVKELHEGVQKAEQEYRKHISSLRERGYRDWRSRNGAKSVFAKVMRVDDEKKIIFLKENGGRVTRTRFSSLSQEDLDYLDTLRSKSKAADKKKYLSADEDSAAYDE